ncbi:MAG: hypothetical protein AMJ70_02745 [Dehalococcoidia bacterium SG8_51_3]|nr:MAG: hypothetical protein AMJ70_02745 [Dehalococcoidia bacterium SG8_51_3]
MWFIAGILGGLIAGIFMAIASQLGHWLGIVKSHLIVIDGTFALRMLKRDGGTAIIYALGTMIHLVTSIVFGVVYVTITRVAGFAPNLPVAIVVYVLILWLAMLAIALPIAGQGFMGDKIRRSVWLEQLVLHIIFGIGFWWALGLGII